MMLLRSRVFFSLSHFPPAKSPPWPRSLSWKTFSKRGLPTQPRNEEKEPAVTRRKAQTELGRGSALQL